MRHINEFFWSDELKAYVRLTGKDYGPPYYCDDETLAVAVEVNRLAKVKQLAVKLRYARVELDIEIDTSGKKIGTIATFLDHKSLDP
jgi:hypothetical protein